MLKSLLWGLALGIAHLWWLWLGAAVLSLVLGTFLEGPPKDRLERRSSFKDVAYVLDDLFLFSFRAFGVLSLIAAIVYIIKFVAWIIR